MDGYKWYLFFLKLRPVTLKHAFLIICITGVMWHAVFTSYTITRLRNEANITTQAYAEFLSQSLYSKMKGNDIKLVLETMLSDIDIPIIITNNSWEPVIWKNISTDGIIFSDAIPENDFSYENIQLVFDKIQALKQDFSPQYIYTSDKSRHIGYLVYGNSNVVSNLAWMPLIEGVFVVIFTPLVMLPTC